jgi:hypothetical protein
MLVPIHPGVAHGMLHDNLSALSRLGANRNRLSVLMQCDAPRTRRVLVLLDRSLRAASDNFDS